MKKYSQKESKIEEEEDLEMEEDDTLGLFDEEDLEGELEGEEQPESPVQQPKSRPNKPRFGAKKKSKRIKKKRHN